MNGVAPVRIRLLGEFGVTLGEAGRSRPKFRSRTAERLLTRLVLKLGRTVPRTVLLDALWPESDGDRQAQNLRRAIADVRQALEADPSRPTLLLSDLNQLWLDPDLVESDVAHFSQATCAGLEGEDAEVNLRTAFRLYAGSLLPDDDDPRIDVHRQELEELYAQVVVQLIALLLRTERQEEALRVGRRAITVAPLREDVHIALMRAYALAGLRSQAIRQFEELESLLDEHWGEPPSSKAIRALQDLGEESPDAPVRSKAPVKPVSVSAGGAVPAGSPFYVARECDASLRTALNRRETTILIHGARQVGKTSLLGSVLTDVRRTPTRVAVTDFQVLSRSQLASPEAFCRAIAYGLTTQLRVSLDLTELWNAWLGPNSNLDAVVETVLAQVEGPVVWAMDESDRLFGTDLADDFFGLVRSWHNRRAMDPEGPFRKLSLVIAYATEAHLFIHDLNQSPFNVGIRIPMRDFGPSETRELALRYGLDLPDLELARLVRVTGGQPFLSRRALDALVLHGWTMDDLEKRAADDDGPFAEHLRRLLDVVGRDEATIGEVRRLVRDDSLGDAKTAHRLIAGGMLVRRGDGSLAFRVPAYRPYLARHLAPGP